MNPHDDRPAIDELELRRALRQLPRERTPDRELWSGIEARLGTTTIASRSASRHWLGTALALAASLLLALALLLRPAAETGAPVQPATNLAAADARAPDELVRREADAITIEYQVALEAFAELPLPPDLQAATTELDASAQQLRDALRAQPDAAYLLDRLRRTYDQRLKLTQRAVLG
jgi:membrane-bound lytic murein transglycosylase B